VIAGLVGRSMAKGMITAGLGLLLAAVGVDPESGTIRLAFGKIEVYDGLPLEAVAVGLLAVGQLFTELVRRANPREAALPSSGDKEANRFRWSDYRQIFPTCLRGGAIGTVIGAIPGVGSTAAAFMSYAMAKRAAKTPERFGNGAPEGIAAAESANSAVVGSNLIPLLTLGIPGNVTAALIVGAFMIQGIQPGPLLFREQGQLIYGLFGAMMMANAMNLCTGLVGLRFWTVVMKLPRTVIMPAALLLCIVGTHVTTGSLFGVGLMLAFGIVGWLMRVFGFPFVPFIIAFVVGPQFEYTIVQTLVLSDGGFGYVLGRPVALALLAVCVFVVWRLGFSKSRQATA
jgi:putative tricarboxylic transport membrane protein